MFTAPAETCNSYFEVLGFERWSIGAESSDEVRNVGVTDGRARLNDPRYEFHRKPDSQEGFDKNIGQNPRGSFDLVHHCNYSRVHRIAF